MRLHEVLGQQLGPYNTDTEGQLSGRAKQISHDSCCHVDRHVTLQISLTYPGQREAPVTGHMIVGVRGILLSLPGLRQRGELPLGEGESHLPHPLEESSDSSGQTHWPRRPDISGTCWLP